MKCEIKIIFTESELEILRHEADKARANWKAAGVFPKRIYEVERYEFLIEHMRGVEPATHKKQQAWLKKIKLEVKRVKFEGRNKRGE